MGRVVWRWLLVLLPLVLLVGCMEGPVQHVVTPAVETQAHVSVRIDEWQSTPHPTDSGKRVVRVRLRMTGGNRNQMDMRLTTSDQALHKPTQLSVDGTRSIAVVYGWFELGNDDQATKLAVQVGDQSFPFEVTEQK